jgi:hypothetical protein
MPIQPLLIQQLFAQQLGSPTELPYAFSSSDLEDDYEQRGRKQTHCHKG